MIIPADDIETAVKVRWSALNDWSPALRLRFITQSGCLLRRCDYHSLKINKYEPSGELGFSAVIFLSFSLRHRLLYFTFAWLVPPTFSGGFFSHFFFNKSKGRLHTTVSHNDYSDILSGGQREYKTLQKIKVDIKFLYISKEWLCLWWNIATRKLLPFGVFFFFSLPEHTYK